MSGSCDDCGNVQCVCLPQYYDLVVGNPLLRETVEPSPIQAAVLEACEPDPRDAQIAALTARCAELAAALRCAHAREDDKAMSTYEQQAERRDERRLLGETAIEIDERIPSRR